MRGTNAPSQPGHSMAMLRTNLRPPALPQKRANVAEHEPQRVCCRWFPLESSSRLGLFTSQTMSGGSSPLTSNVFAHSSAGLRVRHCTVQEEGSDVFQLSA